MNKILKTIMMILGTAFSLISCGNQSLTGSNSGSLIEDRSGGLIMTFVILIIVLLILISGIFLLSKKIVNYKNSPAYIEKMKKRLTSASDVSIVAKEADLSKNERDILLRICKENKTANIIYLVKEIEEIERLLKKEYESFYQKGNEEGKAIIFSLRRKLLKTYKQQVIIKNTKNIELETIFTYTQTKGFHHKLTLVASNPDGMVMSIPKTMEQTNDLPEALSKVTLVFESKDNSPYEIDTRVLRYQDGKDGSKQIILVHTDKITQLQKRLSERIDLQLPCKFSSVKKNPDKSKNGSVNYERSEKEYDGTLEDVSVGGCRIITSLPIKPEQLIFIKGQMNRKDTDTAIGSIVRTTKRNDNNYILHVKFLKIELAVTNRIQAVVCGYDN